MTLFWIGLLIIGAVIVLTFVWRGAPPSTEPRPPAGEGTDGEPLQRGSQILAAGLVLGVGGLAAFPAAFYSSLTYDCKGTTVGLGCVGGDDEVVFMVAFFGMLGFAILGLVSGALASLWRSKASLICMLLGIMGQALAFLGSLVLANAA